MSSLLTMTTVTWNQSYWVSQKLSAHFLSHCSKENMCLILTQSVPRPRVRAGLCATSWSPWTRAWAWSQLSPTPADGSLQTNPADIQTTTKLLANLFMKKIYIKTSYINQYHIGGGGGKLSHATQKFVPEFVECCLKSWQIHKVLIQKYQ